MSGIMMDLTTGDPVLGENTDLIAVDDKTAFKQIIDGLFHCQPGSEIQNAFYGFDLETAIRESSQRDSDMIIESLIIQALDEEKEPLISEVNHIDVELDGRQATATVIITSILDETITLEEQIGET